jgi:WD40 repeat protein/energy-coupling factor transporter ATP-binding protein EcfA2
MRLQKPNQHLIMYTTEEQLRFYAVKVNNGSGCIFQPQSEEYTYVLTAAHNIQGDTATIQRFDLSQPSLVVLDIIKHPVFDLALIVIEKLDMQGHSCYCATPSRGEELTIFGYPQRLAASKEKRDELVCLCGFVNDNKDGFELQTKNAQFTFNNDTQANIIGFSGSGIFAVQENFLVLQGIFYELKDYAGTNNKLHGLFLSAFNELTVNYKLAPLIYSNELVINPYRGVDRFNRQHSIHYFGRDEEIEKLFRTLRDQHFVSIIGMSGSGKSSLVRAGFFRGLEKYRYEFPDPLEYFDFDVSRSPLQNIKLELVKFAKRNEITVTDEKSDAFLEEIIRGLGQTRMVWVLDQFERLINQETIASEINGFIRLINQASSQGVLIILAARIDYYAALAALQGLGQKIVNNPITIFPMNEEALEQVIRGPAKICNCAVEERLVRQLVADTFQSNNALMLLELTLHHIWETDKQKGILTYASFEMQSSYTDLHSGKTLSGIKGILVRLAEKRYAGLSPDENAKLPFIFISLLTTYASATQLSAMTIATRKAYINEFDDDTQKVAERMADSFLLTAGFDENLQQKTIEIGHEALLLHWPRLQEWVKKYEAIMVWMNREFNPYFSIYKQNKKFQLLPYASTKKGAHWAKQYPFLFQVERWKFLNKSQMVYRGIAVFTGLALLAVFLIFGYFRWTQQQQNFHRANENLQKGLSAIGEKDYNKAIAYLTQSIGFNETEEIKENLLHARMLLYTSSQQKLPQKFVTISKDGKLAILCDSTVPLLWDLEQNIALFALPQVKGEIRKAAFSSDANMLALGTDTGMLMVVDIKTRQQILLPNTLSGAISCIAFSADNNWIAWGTEIKELVIFDLKHRKLAMKLNTYSSPVWALDFSANSHCLATAGGDNMLQVWELKSGKWQSRFTVLGGTDVINAISFNPMATLVATGVSDGSIGLFDASSGKPVYYTFGHKNEIADLEFSPSGHYLLSAGEDETVKLWTVYPFSEVVKLQQAHKNPFRIAFCSEDDKFRVGYTDTTVLTWTADHSLYQAMTDTLSYMYAIATDPKGHWLATGVNNESIYNFGMHNPNATKIWDIRNNTLIKAIPTGDKGRVVSLAVSHNGRLVAAACENNYVMIYSTADWNAVDSVYYPFILCTVEFDNKGILYIGGRQDERKTARIYTYNTESKLLDSMMHVGGSVFDITTSANNDTFATGGGDRTVRLWSRIQKRQLAQFGKFTRSVWAVSLSYDGKMLAAGCLDKTIKVFDTRTSSILYSINIHEGGILSINFRPDGEWLASASDDHTVRLHHLNSGKTITLRNNHQPIWSLQFSRDGNMLYACSLDGVISLYNVQKIIEFMK